MVGGITRVDIREDESGCELIVPITVVQKTDHWGKRVMQIVSVPWNIFSKGPRPGRRLAAGINIKFLCDL